MRYYIYRITRIKDGAFYIGRHSSRLPEEKDRYFGGGTRIKRSVKLYGREAHLKEILVEASSLEELISLEAQIVSKDVIKNPKCLNLRPGGKDGKFDFTPERLSQVSKELWTRPEYREKLKDFGHYERSKSTREKMSKIMRSRMTTVNHTSNTVWMTNGFIRKRIPICDEAAFKALGFIRGRKGKAL